MRKFAFFVLIVILMGLVSAEIEGIESTNPRIKLVTKVGTDTSIPLSYFNSLDKDISLLFNLKSDVPFFSLDKSILKIGEKSYGSVNIKVNKELKPGAYFGMVVASDGKSFSETPVFLGLKSTNVLFDVAVEIPQNSLIVPPGGELNIKSTFYNLEAEQSIALVTYSVVDSNGKMLAEQKEILEIGRSEATTVKSIKIPDETLDGSYTALVTVQQGGSGESFALSAEDFKVGSVSFSPVQESNSPKLVLFWIILFLMVSVIVLSYYWNKRVISQGKEWRTKVNEIRSVKFSDAARSIRRLEYQKHLLNKAYSSHYVTRGSYEEGKKEINSLISKLKKRL